MAEVKPKKKLANYLELHKKNFLSEQPFNKTNLQPGAIIWFTYIDDEKKTTKPLVIVLNPVWHGNMHVLRIDEIRPEVVEKLVQQVDLWFNKRLNQQADLRLPLLKVNVGSPKSFYESKLKPLLPKLVKTELPELYREYTINRISNVKLIEYRFTLQEQRDEAALAKKEKEALLMKQAIDKVKAEARARAIKKG